MESSQCTGKVTESTFGFKSSSEISSDSEEIECKETKSRNISISFSIDFNRGFRTQTLLT